jgi:hypothetical protein
LAKSYFEVLEPEGWGRLTSQTLSPTSQKKICPNFLANIQKNFSFQRLSIKKINILALQKKDLK